MYQPKRIATHTCHMRVNDSQYSSRGNRCIHGRTAVA